MYKVAIQLIILQIVFKLYLCVGRVEYVDVIDVSIYLQHAHYHELYYKVQRQSFSMLIPIDGFFAAL